MIEKINHKGSFVMAKIQAKVILSELFDSSKHPGTSYLTGTDLETGKQFKISVPTPLTSGMAAGQVLEINAVVETRPDKMGGVYLGYVSGQLK